MTGKERLTAALTGGKVDRAPMWVREGLDLRGYEDKEDSYGSAWKANAEYKHLNDYIYQYADVISGWSFYPLNRFMCIDNRRISHEKEVISQELYRLYTRLKADGGELTHITDHRRGEETSWHRKCAAEDLDDLYKIISAPFGIDETLIAPAIERYETIYAKTGDRGLVRTGASSPIVCISNCLPFDRFLEYTITERKALHEFLQEITRRTCMAIDAVFSKHSFDVIANMGGSEQCTPPMTSPRDFDEFVVPYDAQIVAKFKQYGVLTSCHCHGKISHALKGIMEAGYVGTDPVEPPPMGDVTFEQARKITGGNLTLFGNLEWSELDSATPEQIKARVREILSFGKERLVVTSSAGPISAMTERQIANYYAWTDAMLEYGAKD